MGDHSRALELQLKALNIYEKVLPAEHPDLGATFAVVGQAYSNTEQFDLALQNFERALLIFERNLPAGHPKLQQLQNTITQLREQIR